MEATRRDAYSAPDSTAGATPLPDRPVHVVRVVRLMLWLIAVLVVPAALIALVHTVDRPPPDIARYVIDTAQYAGPDPPHAESIWEVVALPHRLSQPGNEPKVGWYRVRLMPAPSGQSALFVPHPNGALQLHVDGLRITDVSGDRTALPYHEFPLLLRVPPAAVAHARGDVLVRTARDGMSVQLPLLYFGPADALEAAARRVWWSRAGVSRVAMGAALCVMALTFALFALRRSETAYAWFGLCLLFLVLHIGHDHVAAVPVPRYVWLASTTLCLLLFVACALQFVHRFLGIEARPVERASAILCTASAAALFGNALAFGWTHHALTVRSTVILALVGGAYVFFRLAQAAWRTPTFENHALLAAATTTLGAGTRDFLVDIGVWPGTVFYIGYALLFVVVTFGAMVVRRFARAVSNVEVLSRELESRVVDTSRRVEAEYTRIRELELEETARQERARMLREMNDGIGGQLRTGLDVAREGGKDAVRAVLERCLTDLRLLVDASDAAHGDVLGLLARFRHRVQRGLELSGVELVWEVEDLPPRPLAADEALGVLRMLQGAIAGAVAGGGVRTLAVRTGASDGGRVWLALVDDRREGAATWPDFDRLAAQAREIGAELAIDRTRVGIALRLTLRRLEFGIAP